MVLAALAALIVALEAQDAAAPATTDPGAWWTERLDAPTQAQDPLGGRRLRRGERPIPMDPGVDPQLYRLWGLRPLQTQLVRGREMILEVWARPSSSVRQAVIRIVLRGDGRGFVQARAGLGCCAPEILRRIDIDAELPRDQLAALLALRDERLWLAPRSVVADFGDDAVEDLCVAGVAFDLTLVVSGQARHLHRACVPEVVGQAAPVLTRVLGAAMGRDPRFDVLFPRGADFSRERTAYAALVAQGGRLSPATAAKAQPAAVAVIGEDSPESDPEPAETP